MDTQNEKCSWTKFSEKKLIELEETIRKVVKTACRSLFVNIGDTVGQDDKIWTVAYNETSKGTPLVLLHGFAAALGFWCPNIDYLAKHRPVYTLDLLGFGRSSRPTFSSDHLEAEQQFVNSIEAWRNKLKLDKIILLGHSFGGYLATSYALRYPERVQHLILADPWGFPEKAENYTPSFYFRVLRILLYPLTLLNPLATMRAVGPAGPWIVRKTRGDIAEKFSDYLEDPNIISEYIHQCNAQNPTGETAFKSMVKSFAYAKSPMINRIDKMNKEVPITFIYGNDSWIGKESGQKIKEERSDSFVELKIVEDAGHHVNIDQPQRFSEMVITTCQQSDEGLDVIERRISIEVTKSKLIEVETCEKPELEQTTTVTDEVTVH